MNYEPALKEARRLVELGGPTTIPTRTIITTKTLKELLLGVESFLKLEQAIENACDEDTQSEISFEYRILTGEIDRDGNDITGVEDDE